MEAAEQAHNFFRSAAEAMCGSTSASHCIVQSFVLVPAAAIFVLVIPFAFGGVMHEQPTSAYPAAGKPRLVAPPHVRVMPRWLGWSSVAVSLLLAFLPIIEIALVGGGYIGSVEHDSGSVRASALLYAGVCGAAFLLNAGALVQRLDRGTGRGCCGGTAQSEDPYGDEDEDEDDEWQEGGGRPPAPVSVPDYMLSWWVLAMSCELVQLVVSALQFNAGKDADAGRNALDAFSMAHAAVAAALALPGLWYLLKGPAVLEGRMTAGEALCGWAAALCAFDADSAIAAVGEYGPGERVAFATSGTGAGAPRTPTSGYGSLTDGTDGRAAPVPAHATEPGAWRPRVRSPEERAGLCSRVYFIWMSPLMLLGWARPLQATDLPGLSEEDTAESVRGAFEAAWQAERRRARAANQAASRVTGSGAGFDSTGGSGSLAGDIEPGSPYADLSGTGAGADARTRGGRRGSGPGREALLGNSPGNKQDRQQRGGADTVSEEVEPQLWWALAVAFGGQFYGALLLKLLYDCLQFVGPNLLDAIITYLDDFSAGKRGATAGVGYGYVATLFGVSVLATALLHQYFLRVFRVGQTLRSSVVVSVFRKALHLSVGARQSAKVGRIVNLLSTDATRMQDLTTYLAMVVSGPFQMSLSLYFLWKQMGPSVLAGVAVMILFIPINLGVARLQKWLQSTLMTLKDKRVDSTNEAIQSIRLIKLSAWESRFETRIREQRESELS